MFGSQFPCLSFSSSREREAPLVLSGCSSRCFQSLRPAHFWIKQIKKKRENEYLACVIDREHVISEAVPLSKSPFVLGIHGSSPSRSTATDLPNSVSVPSQPRSSQHLTPVVHLISLLRCFLSDMTLSTSTFSFQSVPVFFFSYVLWG